MNKIEFTLTILTKEPLCEEILSHLREQLFYSVENYSDCILVKSKTQDIAEQLKEEAKINININLNLTNEELDALVIYLKIKLTNTISLNGVDLSKILKQILEQLP